MFHSNALFLSPEWIVCSVVFSLYKFDSGLDGKWCELIVNSTPLALNLRLVAEATLTGTRYRKIEHLGGENWNVPRKIWERERERAHTRERKDEWILTA